MALPSGCIAGSQEARKMLWRLPPIHFGKEDGVERTLLRVACQSVPFLASPWQGDASIRFLWHIGFQSEFDELVSLVSRPVYRGSCRRKCFSTSFYQVKSHFGSWEASKLSFVRRKAGLPGRKQLITKVQAQASRPIELGAALFSNMYSMFMTLFHFL